MVILSCVTFRLDERCESGNCDNFCVLFTDLFYTRVSPSKTFDLLKEDFDHFLITAVLLGLTLTSYITKKLASRKALKQAWK
jgi:hypothetical protein